MIRINLLPVKAVQRKEFLQGQLVVLGLGVLLVAVVCAGLHVSVQGTISKTKAKADRLQSEIDQLKRDIGEVGRFKKLQQELQAKLDVLDKLKAGKSGPVLMLKEMSLATPGKVWISSFKESGGSISVDGVGLNEEAVAQFLRDLEASPAFQAVELQVTQQVSREGRKLQSFSVSARLESPSPVKNR